MHFWSDRKIIVALQTNRSFQSLQEFWTFSVRETSDSVVLKEYVFNLMSKGELWTCIWIKLCANCVIKWLIATPWILSDVMSLWISAVRDVSGWSNNGPPLAPNHYSGCCLHSSALRLISGWSVGGQQVGSSLSVCMFEGISWMFLVCVFLCWGPHWWIFFQEVH